MTGVSPAGAVFPYDFRFIPKTPGGDGDPLNVLVLMDKAGVHRMPGTHATNRRDGSEAK